MRHIEKLIATLIVAVLGIAPLIAQSTCGEQDPFWLPPSRTFCVDTNNVATISFKLLNLGAPGDYTVSFPDGATAKYLAVEDTVTVSHQLEFLCSQPPGSPSAPSQESPFYAYQGELSIVRTDCVDSQGDAHRGSYDFNVIPNPLERIKTSQLTCLQSPYMIDLEAQLCQDDLVESYQWFLDGAPIANSDGPKLKSLIIPQPGTHLVRVEAVTNKEGCGPFFLEKEITVTPAPTLAVEFLVDSSTLCLPVVTIVTATTASNVKGFLWSSDSPDVSFSNPAVAAPVITIDNRRGGRREIRLTANSENCGEVSETFILRTYNDQELKAKRPLTTCSNETYRLCEDLEDVISVESIVWTDTDPTTTIHKETSACPEIEFRTPGDHILVATGIDVCGRPFTQSLKVRVRDNVPLKFDLTAIDTLCDQEPAVDLSNHIFPWRNVSNLSGPGVSGQLFDPSGLQGEVKLAVTDSCGASSELSIYVLRLGTFNGEEPTICEGELIDLTTLQPGRYQGPGVVDNVFSAADLEPGLYEIEYTSEAYCGGTSTLTVTVQPPPQAGFSIATPSCPGGPSGMVFPAGKPIRLVNLSVSEVICYSVVETGASVCGSREATFTFPSAGTYTLQQVVRSRGTQCTDTIRQTLAVEEDFAPDFTYDLKPVGCDSLILTLASKGVPADVVPGWSLSNGKVLQARKATFRMAKPFEARRISIFVNASNGCFAVQDTLSFQLPRRFQVAFGILNDNRTVCSGDTVYLKDNSVNAEQVRATFPDGSTTPQLPLHLVLKNDTEEVLAYPITLSGSSPGCDNQTFTDTVFVLPVATRAGFSLAYTDNCSSEDVALVNLSTPGSSGRVFWGDGSSPQWVDVGDTIYHRYEVGQDTTVSIALEATLCGTDSYKTNFMIRAAPNPAFSIPQTTSRCVGDTLRFVPVVNAEAFSVDWDFGDGNFSQHDRPRHVYNAPGTYRIIREVTTPYGCLAADTATITIGTYSGPALDATIPEAACVGGPFPVDIHSTAAGLRFDYGGKQRSAGPLDRPFSRPGDFPFTLTVFDEKGCRSDTTVHVMVHPQLSVAIKPGARDTTLDLGNSLELTYEVLPPRPLDSVLWSGSGVADPRGGQTRITPVTDELYRLDVMDHYGCIASDSLMVRVRTDYRDRVYSPNVFSPNGDGINEYFYLQVKPNTVRSIASIRIRSRWGAVVYECRECAPGSMDSGWDGNFNGSPAKTGVYLWSATVEFVDGTQELFTGDVVLIR